MYAQTPNNGQMYNSMQNLRRALYTALIAAACGNPVQHARVQGSLVEKLDTGKQLELTLGISDIVEGGESLGLTKGQPIKVAVAKPIPEPYSSQLGQCLTPATFGTYECDGDFEIEGKKGQDKPYHVAQVHQVNVRSPITQAGEKASDVLKKGAEKAQKGYEGAVEWLKRKKEELNKRQP